MVTDEDFRIWYDINHPVVRMPDFSRQSAFLAWKECRKRATMGYIDLKRAGELLKQASKAAFIAAGGTEQDFKVWYKNHCTQNIN